MTLRRTALFFCLAAVIVAALVPCAIVVAPSLAGRTTCVVDAGAGYAARIEVVSSPLLARITPRHLARASLPFFAA